MRSKPERKIVVESTQLRFQRSERPGGSSGAAAATAVAAADAADAAAAASVTAAYFVSRRVIYRH